MTISSSLMNAYSGLSAAARTAEAISQNIANALTQGYGRRVVELRSAAINGQGAGVRVAAVYRNVDAALIASRQQAEAHSDGAATRATAFAQIEAMIGTPGESGSLNDLIVRFETSLTSAASRPDLLVRQQNILFAARDLVAHVNGMSSDAQTMRMQADHEIADKVGFLNDGLAGIAQLNRDIGIQIGSGRDANGLLDQRQVLVDQIAGIVPLRTYSRDNGQIALVSTGGAVLLDGSAAVFEFTSAGKITADMTQASGALSGLSMNGQPVRIGDNGLLEGGSLAALFEVRDTIAPMASAQADAFARDLVERFQASGVDPTVAIGAAGLFTDDGAAFDSLNEIGLAGRLMLSAAVDPAAGGDLSRFRDGLAAVIPGNLGDSALLTRMAAALSQKRSPVSGTFSTAQVSTSDLAGALASLNSSARIDAEQNQAFATGRLQEFRVAELATGVDTDQELQHLLLIEKAYAANAKVISTADEMLTTLLGI